MDHYPDLDRLGGLGPAVDAELSARGSPLRVCPVWGDTLPFGYARVVSAGRSSDLSISTDARRFFASFWCQGVQYASGSIPDLPAAVRAVDLFLRQGCSSATLRQECPWVSLTAGVVHEAGPVAYVGEAWGSLLSWLASEAPSSAMSQLAPLARAAHDHPVLRSLMPFTSMSWLCFSRCTGYPFDVVGLCAAPDGQGGFLLGRRDAPTVTATSIEATIGLIVSSLPEGVGPALHGTADSS